MCIFASDQPIVSVAGTKIFARRTDGDRQILVYEMRVALASDAAMVLPLPIPPGSAEDAVEFVDLSVNREFFDQMAKAFPAPVMLSVGGGFGRSAAPPQPRLVVHQVGDFEASFVPTPADFGRLDPRFRLSSTVLSALPEIADWGFAVFKLRSGGEPPKRSWWSRLWGRAPQPPSGAPPSKKIHPMAMSFPTRRPGALFFPTVHVHDGAVHEQARFDHDLYCQLAPGEPAAEGWKSSSGPLGSTMRPSAGLVELGRPGYKRTIRGTHPNRDTWIEL